MEMSEKIFQVEKYIGKELKRTGGEGDSAWKLYRLKFDTGGQFPFTVDSFDGVGTKEGAKSVTLKDLEEGEYYKIGYHLKKDAFQAHGKSHDSRTLFAIVPSTEEEYEKDKEERLSQREHPDKQTTSKEITQESLEQFLDKYRQDCEDKKELKKKESFIIRWFLNKHKDEFLQVYNFAKENIADETSKKVDGGVTVTEETVE